MTTVYFFNEGVADYRHNINRGYKLFVEEFVWLAGGGTYRKLEMKLINSYMLV